MLLRRSLRFLEVFSGGARSPKVKSPTLWKTRVGHPSEQVEVNLSGATLLLSIAFGGQGFLGVISGRGGRDTEGGGWHSRGKRLGIFTCCIWSNLPRRRSSMSHLNLAKKVWKYAGRVGIGLALMGTMAAMPQTTPAQSVDVRITMGTIRIITIGMTGRIGLTGGIWRRSTTSMWSIRGSSTGGRKRIGNGGIIIRID